MIESEFITWEAPDGDHPARRASQRSYDAVSRKAKDEWLALFADDAVLADPVGPSFFDETGEGHKGKAAIAGFWEMAIAPVERFQFTIRDSFANGNACANIGTFSTRMADGTLADTDLIAVYRINDEGLITAMNAHWEVERTMATLRKE
ncbi:nuclear transport factor 2 family protein [Nocardioides sp. AE5]|uniref:nuclear transport factor 2 family protein n=1 Tax=Nocardioides sp. AE5 TaxID=2962573 RepID=UPI0028819301|nr:nuclear transport factor 2 family protein [Nocardioides sp. AE5]MDT0203468.1 nuclear transport factor 2 family protein [Nocardioides sp. AE5]